MPSLSSNRTRRIGAALHDFALVPAIVVLAFVALAGISIVGDQAHVAILDPLRARVSTLISGQAASTALQAIATGLLTVTSITFSVLLLAVQQTASNLSPVVFDQFARRRQNQALVGFFVGLAVYAYAVLGLQGGTAPVLGAAMATTLTVVGMFFLLLVIHTTINQMRPTHVLRQIHGRTLRARENELEILRRTRRTELAQHPVSAAYHAETDGYLNAVTLDTLASIIEDSADAEVILHKVVGDFVARGDPIASVRDGDEQVARRLASRLRQSITIGTHRDLDHDPTTGIDQLGNIAWTSASTAKQNPEIAREALDLIRDLAFRLLEDDPAIDNPEPLRIVYPRRDRERVLEVLFSTLVASHESHQHQTGGAGPRRLLQLGRASRSRLTRAPCPGRCGSGRPARRHANLADAGTRPAGAR